MTVYRRVHAADQQLDIAGSSNPADTVLPLTDESAGLGAVIRSGVGGTITVAGVVSGLSGMSSVSVGNFLTLSSVNNNGTFLITEFINASTVIIEHSTAVAETGLDWSERYPYSLADDLNYVRTDRAQIKGVGYDQPVPEYYRCADTVTAVPVNLSNIAGKTTDAKSLVVNRKFDNASISVGDGYYLMSGVYGTYPYADTINRTGVPISDGADAGNLNATEVDILDGYSSSGLFVFAGTHSGWRIYGRTRQGTYGVDGYSVEVEFRAVQPGFHLDSSVPYTWEVEQPPNYIDFYYPYRECLDSMDESALRTMVVNGIISGPGLPKPTQVGEVLYSVNGENFSVAIPLTSDQGWLVNDQGILLVL